MRARLLQIAIVGLGLTAALAPGPEHVVVPVHAQAASSGAAAPLPDIVGFRPGMALQDAYRMLKAHNPKMGILADEIVVPELSDQKLPQGLMLGNANLEERIRLDITLPPTKQVVWKVSRSVFFQQGQEQSRANLIAALRGKYGQEFVPPGADRMPGASLSWFFNERGGRETGGVGFNYCFFAFGGDYGLTFRSGPTPYVAPQGLAGPIEQVPAAHRPCGSLVFVNAVLASEVQGTDPSRIRSMSVVITDVGLRTRSQRASYEQVLKVQGGQQEDERDKAKRRAVPKL